MNRQTIEIDEQIDEQTTNRKMNRQTIETEEQIDNRDRWTNRKQRRMNRQPKERWTDIQQRQINKQTTETDEQTDNRDR